MKFSRMVVFFTRMPTIAHGRYHPQYFGRTSIQKVEVRE